MMPSTLSQLFAPDSVEIVTNLDIQNTRPRCTSPPCPSHDACGLKDKNPELKEKISEVQKEIKHSHAKLKAFCESRTNASTSLFDGHAAQTEGP